MHRILVVDDDAIIRRLLAAALSADHEVVEAADAATALRSCDLDGPFDLVMVDWMLDGMTGVELIREIRRSPGSLARVPIVMLSAKYEVEAEDLAYEAGADAYLTKPFNPDVLESLVSVMLLAARSGTGVPRASRSPLEVL